MDNITVSYFEPILQSIIAGYLLLLFTKLYSYFRIINFLGSYREVPKPSAETQNLEKVRYTISHNILNLLTPVLHITVKIARTNTGGRDRMDWQGKYYSDILNPFHFKGIYIITNPGPNDSDGWHEMLCFIHKERNGKVVRRVATKINYLNISTSKWQSDGGYFIEKIDKQTLN